MITSFKLQVTSYLLRFLLILISCFSYLISFSQSPTDLPTINKVYADGIQSLKLTPAGALYGQPIIQLFSGERLDLSFDDLLQKDRYLKYTLIHCTHNWQYSSLNQIEYLDGFFEDLITDYSFSFNSIVPYTHYRLRFPTHEMRILKSGNYLLVVYDDNMDNPVLTRRFMVVDAQQAGIKANVTYAQDVQYRSIKQQVDFTVYTGTYSIRNPAMYLHATILQNGRWDNAIEGLTYRTAKPGEYGFNFDNLNRNVFNGSNEFRTFDIRTLRSPADRITSVNFNNRLNQAYVMEDLARPWGAYVTNTTLKGHCMYGNSDGNFSEDYVWVHFTLRCDFQVGDGDLYVFGELTNWQIDPKAKLKFNPENNYWENSLYLKQGYYNYIYVFVPKGKGAKKIDDTYIEGSHWQTQNDYTILLYLQEEGTSYDKLIGTVTSTIGER